MDGLDERKAAVPQAGTSKPTLGLMGLGLAVVLVAVGIAAAESYRDLEAALRRQASLENAIQETQLEIQRLSEWIEQLRTDPVALERVAREELGLAAPQDVILVLPEVESAAEKSP